MSKFSEAMKKPLPSKATKVPTAEEILEKVESELFDGNTLLTESAENTIPDGDDAVTTGETVGDKPEPEPTNQTTECGNCAPGAAVEDGEEEVNGDDIEDTGDDFDIDDMSEEEMMQLDAELSGEAIDAVDDEADVDEITLSPDEEMQADDMMNMAATTMLVNDELNAEEKAQFIESQGNIAVEEGFMTEADITEMANELSLFEESKYNKKMIIRLDAAAKKKQLFELAVNVSAAAHGDPDYIKYKKCMKLKKIYRNRMRKKYKGEASKRMKIYFARLRNSKSGVLNKIGKKHS